MGYQRYEVQYPAGFKTVTFSGRSVQIASNLECMQRGPVAIDLFCLLIFILSVTEIQLCKVNVEFPRSFRANQYGKPHPIQCMGKLLVMCSIVCWNKMQNNFFFCVCVCHAAQGASGMRRGVINITWQNCYAYITCMYVTCMSHVCTFLLTAGIVTF